MTQQQQDPITAAVMERIEPEAAAAFNAGMAGPDDAMSLSASISLKRIADLLEVSRADDGTVITLPQIMLRLVQALEPTNQSGMNTITEALHGIMLNGR